MLGRPWFFFPLYGLELVDDDGLSAPIFGDATLISPAAVAERAPDPGAASMFRYEPIRTYLPAWKPVRPVDSLFEIPPDSFIAVSSTNIDKATLRANTLRSYLSGMMFLRTRTAAAFGSSPLELAWTAAPKAIKSQPGSPSQLQIMMVGNDHIIHNAVCVSKPSLRDSWKSGCDIDVGYSNPWDIHRDFSFSQVLVAPGRSNSLFQLLRSAARHIQRAQTTRDPFLAILQCITAWELILGTSKSKELQARVTSFFGASNAADIEKVLSSRHEFVHQGTEIDEPGDLLLRALALTWTLLDLACCRAANAAGRKDYESQLELLAFCRSNPDTPTRAGVRSQLLNPGVAAGRPSPPAV